MTANNKLDEILRDIKEGNGEIMEGLQFIQHRAPQLNN